MIAVSYLRVSSEGQVDQGGFPRQREAVKTFADSRDFQIIQEYRDEGVNGDLAWDQRPGMCVMLMGAASLGVQVILVEQSSRLGRDSVETEIAVRKCCELNLKVFSALDGQHLTTDTIDGKMVRQIKFAVAEAEKARLKYQMRKGRDRVRQLTGRCEGPKPYGHYDGEAHILDSIKKMRRAGFSYEFIAESLNMKKVPTRKGGLWYGSTIQKLLKRNARIVIGSQAE